MKKWEACVSNLLHVEHLSQFKVLIQHGNVGLYLVKWGPIFSLIRKHTQSEAYTNHEYSFRTVQAENVLCGRSFK